MAKPKTANAGKPTPPTSPTPTTKRPAVTIPAKNPPRVVVPGLNPDLFDPDRFHPVVDVAELLAQQAEHDALQTRCNRIVILMLENRSFDHVFGRLGPQRGGLTLTEENTLPPVPPPGSSSQHYPVHPLDSTEIEF